MASFIVSDEACPHSWDESVMVRPSSNTTVHRDECAYCCRTCLHGGGVYVCMCCHTGLCAAHITKHLSLRPTHVMYTRIKQLLSKESEMEIKDVNQLAVVEAIEYESAVCCTVCRLQFATVPELAVDSYLGIMNAPVPGAQAASAQDPNGSFIHMPQCPHLVCLEQEPSPFSADRPPTSDDKCFAEGCDCQLNNWMCLTCGVIGCPRRESGGQGHALQHFLSTGHQATVKLGTVTEKGGDFYCYSCDDSVSDVHMETHLKHFGIDMRTAKKTAKTMGEMEYDYSTQFDYNKMTEAGADLTPAYGPGHTGIHNIGNSCYIASVVQCLMRLPAFKNAFYPGRECVHQKDCPADPYGCRACQMERIASGLLSGEFSKPGGSTKENGVNPRCFKRAYAQSHPEFSTGQQQDAQEYLQYLLEQLKRYVKPATTTAATHPSDLFEMVMEQRVECDQCHRVRYSREKETCVSLPIPIDPEKASSAAAAAAAAQAEGKMTEEELAALRPRVTLEECLKASVSENDISCFCGACKASATYKNTTRMATFPDVFVVSLRRAYFDVQALSTKKLDALVDVPEEIDLQAFRGNGLQLGEVEMPPSTPRRAGGKTAPGEAAVDEIALVTLVSMGVNEEVAKYALQQTGMDVERAVDYVFSHPEIDAEMAGAAGSEGDLDAAQPGTATAATDGASTYQLTAMISHMGASAKTGHYVCHIKDADSGKWLLFNDEKVGESQTPPFSMASIYFFTRKNFQ